MGENKNVVGVGYSAVQYAKTKADHRWREVVQWYTIRQLLGDVTGLRVLDAGCGDGSDARRIIDMGASHVVAVDKTEGMIDLARKSSGGYEDKIEYRHSPMEDFWGKGDCDIALGSFLLNNAKSPEELTAYVRAVASHLKRGGWFVVFNDNPFQPYYDCIPEDKYAKYGFRKIIIDPNIGGRIEYWVTGVEEPIVNYRMTSLAHERAFAAAKMQIEWHDVSLDPSEEQNKEYWDIFFDGESPFIATLGMKL